jgi:hypothetical protein
MPTLSTATAARHTISRGGDGVMGMDRQERRGRSWVMFWRLIVLIALATTGPPATPPGVPVFPEPVGPTPPSACSVCGRPRTWLPNSERWVCTWNKRHKQKDADGE